MPVIINSRSTRQRVLAAIRWYFREYGDSPSHTDIGELAGIAAKRVYKYVDELQEAGYLTYQPRVARSILLFDRAAMLSDQEFRLAAIARGLALVESSLPALATAFPVDAEEGVADWGLQLLSELDDKG